jgi:ABC-type phosphate transport system substrate-binding protein
VTIKLRETFKLLATVVVVTVLCCSESNQNSPNIKTISSNYPLVDGSTSTNPLSVLLACKIFGISYEWKMPPGSERTVFPSHGGNPFKAKFIEDNIKHHGTHDAYMNLAMKKVDLIFVARGPSEREIQTAKKLGTSFDLKPIALDALVFVVNKTNTIESLTFSEIRAIYAPGGLRRWSQLGGSDAPIEPFQREEDSGSQEIFQKLVMKDIPIGSPNEIPVVYTMAGPVHAVALHENGIAFSVYYYITNMAQNKSVKLVRVNSVMPSSQTIATEEYPLIAEVFAVMRVDTNEEGTARMLRNWLATREGRSAIQESGYVPIPK